MVELGKKAAERGGAAPTRAERLRDRRAIEQVEGKGALERAL